MKLQTCVGCLRKKALSAFYFREPGKPRRRCKKCHSIKCTWAARYPRLAKKVKRRHYLRHREKIIARSLLWQKEHPVRARARKRRWARQNPEKIRLKAERYRRNNPNVRVLEALRARLYCFANGRKSAHTAVLLGCDIPTLRAHLRRQFKSGMSWKNWGNGIGKWNIDHVRPCASFSDLTDPEQQRQCFHYTNLQPLWQPENGAKGARFLGTDYRKAA